LGERIPSKFSLGGSGATDRPTTKKAMAKVASELGKTEAKARRIEIDLYSDEVATYRIHLADSEEVLTGDVSL
jgi:hypothetical protein